MAKLQGGPPLGEPRAASATLPRKGLCVGSAPPRPAAPRPQREPGRAVSTSVLCPVNFSNRPKPNPGRLAYLQGGLLWRMASPTVLGALAGH